MSDVQEALHQVLRRVAEACGRVGRPPDAVRLVAVTKTVPPERILEAVEAGQRRFGENRVQEALAKMAVLPEGLEWHLVGRLQTNKAGKVVRRFRLIHSVDRPALVEALSRRAAAREWVQPVLLEVNLAGEATKAGVPEEGLEPLARQVLAAGGLDLQGLMTLPPPAPDPEDARVWFRKLRELRDRLEDRLGRALPELSMGMTDDFEVAVEEGATLVRVGRAIFGERPT